MLIKIKVTESLLPVLQQMAKADPDNARWIATKILDHNREKRGQPIPMSLEEVVSFLKAINGIEPVDFEVT